MEAFLKLVTDKKTKNYKRFSMPRVEGAPSPTHIAQVFTPLDYEGDQVYVTISSSRPDGMKDASKSKSKKSK